MFRKDFTHNLWVVWLPLLVTAAAGAIKLFKISMVNFGPNDLVSGFFMFNFLFVLPIMAFLSGIVLFQQEEWHLVWGMPGSRMKVMVQKTLAGFFLVVFSIVVSFTIFSLLHDESITAADIALFWLPISVLFLLGTLSGIATRSILSGIMLILTSGFTAFLFTWFTGLWTKMVLSIAWVGPVIIGLYLVIMILLLKISITFLFYWSREYRPFRRFITAFSLLTLSILMIFFCNVGFFQSMTTVKDVKDFKDYWVTRVGSEGATIVGIPAKPGWLRDLAGWFDVEFSGWDIGILYNFQTGKTVQLNRTRILDSITLSPDGKYAAYVLTSILPGCGPNTEIEAVDLKGDVHYSKILDVNQVNQFDYSHLFWSPDGSELNIFLGGQLQTVEMEDGEENSISLPSSGELYRIHSSCTFHSCRYTGSHLIYLRIYGEDGYQVFQYDGPAGSWNLIHEKGVPKETLYETLGGGYYFSIRSIFKYGDGFIQLYGSEEGVKVQVQSALLMEIWSSISTKRGLLKNNDFRLSLTDWENGEAVYDVEVSFTRGRGFAHGDRAFLAAYQKQMKSGGFEDPVFMFVEIPTGKIIKEVEVSEASQSHYLDVLQVRGPVGTLYLNDRIPLTVDIETLTVKPILLQK